MMGTMSNSDIDRVAAWRSLLLAHNRAVRAIESDLSREGTVPLGWYDVLLELAAADDGQLRMQELGVRAVLSRTRVSRIVTELEGAGLVERCPDPADGRAALAVITAAGRRAQRETAPVYLDSIERQFTRHLTEREQRTIASALQRVVDAHRAVTDPRR
jgi:DNA-binding MarR family transcriptional regulator